MSEGLKVLSLFDGISCVICRQEGAAMHRYRGDPVHIYCLRGKLCRDIKTI